MAPGGARPMDGTKAGRLLGGRVRLMVRAGSGRVRLMVKAGRPMGGRVKAGRPMGGRVRMMVTDGAGAGRGRKTVLNSC